MNLKIDNFDGAGARDYSGSVDGLHLPKVVRRLNEPEELQLSLVSDDPAFVVPVSGARVTLGKTNGQDVFTGYIAGDPVHEYLGWGERGPIYRYNVVALSDEAKLDGKRIPDRPPFVERAAGDALRVLTEDLLPSLDVSGIETVEVLPWCASNPQKTWSEHARDIALRAGGCYRVSDGEVTFSALGKRTWKIDEEDERFSPCGLTVQSKDVTVNDVTVIGRVEPSDYVKDYFVG